MKSYPALLLIFLFHLPVFSQSASDYNAFFEEAYQQYSGIPKGLLESVAWNNTRLTHLRPRGREQECLGLPQYYGVMGLVEDGKGYFNNNLDLVASLSGFSKDQIKNDPRSNILAYAAAYNKTQQNKRVSLAEIGAQRAIVASLSEIPQDGSQHNQFAADQQFYSILHQMENSEFQTSHRFANPSIDYEAIFGKDNYEILSASWIEISSNRIRNRAGQEFMTEPAGRAPSCTAAKNSANYAGAIWSPANASNFGSRDEAKPALITIHTIQGSYASAISWFKNSAARVSAHYIIRASDGQVTQMVCEEDKAFHVRQDNAQAIGIEHEGFIDQGATWYTSAMYESSAALVRDLASRHGINPTQTYSGPPTQGIKTLGNKCTRIKGHQHFPGNTHVDPGPFWDWDRYFRLINPELKPTTLTDKNGTFVDPGGPSGNYKDQDRRAYLIQPQNAAEVRLAFEEWEMEGDAADPYDYLDIWEGPDRNARYLGRFTGSESPGTLNSRTGAFYIEFRSDCQFNKKGWRASYTSKRKGEACAPPENLQEKGLYPLGASLLWEKAENADFYLVYLKRTNIGNQRWALYKTSQNGLSVTGLAGDAQYQWQIQTVCGSDTSALVGSNFNTPPISKKGAAQAYRVRLNQGRFYDSGGLDGPYSNEEAFLYTIAPPDGGNVELVFEEFDTEEDLDVMKIFDGATTGSRMIGKYSGTESPGKVISTGNALTIQFTSDSRSTGKGWIASWKTSSGSGGSASTDPSPGSGDSGTSGDGGTGSGNSAAGAFSVNLNFAATAPQTSANLKDVYGADFTLQFSDKDKSGRGLANRFYSLAEYSPNGWRGNSDRGFFYDDFDGGMHPEWKKVSGKWGVNNGRLQQTDKNEGNSNLYAPLIQEGSQTYIYSWQGRFTGDSDNQRFGLHFFCSDPEKENRGNSYFAWIRESVSGDKIELYKVVNDQFDLKSEAQTTLEPGQAYDFKVIYNPRKGRMEVYQNNQFVVSWVDPTPLTSGKALSLRTGGAAVELDNLIVFQNRGSSAVVKVGKSRSNDIRVESPAASKPAMRVLSLVVDRSITWSKVSIDDAQIKFGETSTASSATTKPPSSGSSTGSGSPQPPATGSSNTGRGSTPPSEPKPVFQAPLSKGPWLRDTYSDAFVIDLLPRSGVSRQFFLVSENNGKYWTANESKGFYIDEFPGPMPDPRWKTEVGDWSINVYGRLEQEDEKANNGNISLPLSQQSNTAYLYDWNARFLTKGDNLRFGLHFFCSDPRQTNRGNSYLIWFRNYDSEPDKVEVYRSENNEMELKQRATINLKPEEWFNCKVAYDPRSGRIEVYLNNQIAVSWADPFPLRTGGYLSFRTGNAKIAFDDLHVYQQYQGRFAVGVGKLSTDLMRYNSKGNQPAGRIYTLEQDGGGQWYNPAASEVKIKY